MDRILTKPNLDKLSLVRFKHTNNADITAIDLTHTHTHTHTHTPYTAFLPSNWI
jgi:hypothetical protein